MPPPALLALFVLVSASALVGVIGLCLEQQRVLLQAGPVPRAAHGHASDDQP